MQINQQNIYGKSNVCDQENITFKFYDTTSNCEPSKIECLLCE